MVTIKFYSTSPEYAYLSNFYRVPQVLMSHGIHYRYKSNEHFYQASKAIDQADHDRIASAWTPLAAKRRGRSLRTFGFRNDWTEARVDVMRRGLRAKFTQNHELKCKLLTTGTAILQEDSPTDLFWGRRGKNMLGRLLMELREELRVMVK